MVEDALYLQWPTDTVVYGLLNGTIFSDLEQPVTQFLRSHRSLVLNISETVRDHTDIVK